MELLETYRHAAWISVLFCYYGAINVPRHVETENLIFSLRTVECLMAGIVLGRLKEGFL
jgi:hypothetical protein